MTAREGQSAEFHILGDEDTVLGFSFAGVSGTVVADLDEARRVFLNEVRAKRHRILMLTEVVEQMLDDEVNAHRLTASAPYLVVVGDIAETKVARKNLQQTIQEAVGIRIVKSENE